MARQKGRGHIFKRGKGFYLQFDIAGKRKTVSLKTTDSREAAKKAQELLEPAIHSKTKEEVIIHAAKARKLISSASIPLENIWREYLKNPSRPDSSKGTLGNYERHLNNFLSWLKQNHPGVSKLADITEDIAREYADYLWEGQGKKIASNTFNYHIQSLSLISRILKSKGGLDSNPWDIITRKTEIKQKRRDFTKQQVNALFEAFRNDDLKLMNKAELEALFHIAAFSGLRLIDAVNLKWTAVDLARNIISLIPVKTRKIQRHVNIPLHPGLREKLEAAQEWKDDSGYVLPETAGRYSYNPDGVAKDCIKVLSFCGLNEKGEGRGRKRRLYGFHSFRHFFASTCADAGVPIATLAEILGDNIQTLNKYYVHAQEESRAKIIAALDAGNQKIEKSQKDLLLEELSQELLTASEVQLKEVIKYCKGLKAGKRLK